MLVSTPRPDSAIFNIPRKGKELAADHKGEKAVIKPSSAVSASPGALPPTAIAATGQEPVVIPVLGAVPSGDAPLSPAWTRGARRGQNPPGRAQRPPQLQSGLCWEGSRRERAPHLAGPSQLLKPPPSHQAAHGPPALPLLVSLGHPSPSRVIFLPHQTHI